MTLPNFLIIGAAKSGTSSLFSYLGQHPEIYTSPIKGPCFFAFEEGQKVKVSGPGDQEVFDRHIITDLGTYRALFDGVRDEKAFGEASVLYLYSPTAPSRIKRYIPDVKLIAILRNPVDRAFSSFLHLRRDGREPRDDFADGLKAEDGRVAAQWQHLWHYTRVGFYYTQLSRYFDVFRSDQMAIYTYDEFRTNTPKVLREIFSFLGVNDAFVPNTSTWHNVSGIPKLRSMHTFLTRPNRIKRIVKPLFPSSLRKTLRSQAIKWNTVTGKSKLSEDTRRYLIDLYREDILKLQSLIQRDLSPWLGSRPQFKAGLSVDAAGEARAVR